MRPLSIFAAGGRIPFLFAEFSILLCMNYMESSMKFPDFRTQEEETSFLIVYL
jgi:hypothetical protein